MLTHTTERLIQLIAMREQALSQAYDAKTEIEALIIHQITINGPEKTVEWLLSCKPFPEDEPLRVTFFDRVTGILAQKGLGQARARKTAKLLWETNASRRLG